MSQGKVLEVLLFEQRRIVECSKMSLTESCLLSLQPIKSKGGKSHTLWGGITPSLCHLVQVRRYVSPSDGNLSEVPHIKLINL